MAIVRCGCMPESKAANFQDQRYGAGWRVANETAKDGVVRCTVCNKESGGGFGKRK